LKRGSIRVRGIYKTGLMVLFAVEATNRRLIDGYAPKTKTFKRRGRKPKLGMLIHNPIIDVQSNSPPEQLVLAR
jgi:hypothetical protein